MLRVFLFVAFLASACFAESAKDERDVRRLIERWDNAYRQLDSKTLAALETPDFELINRLGQWTPFSKRENNERMWAWAFTNIYNGKPGPRHTVERVRFVVPDVAIIQARAFWADPINLPGGIQIPPHGEIDTFVAVKQQEGWRIASQNIHNQMPGDELPARLPWDDEGEQP